MQVFQKSRVERFDELSNQIKVDEIALINELKNGHEAAFRSLVDTYRDLVVNTCYSMVHSREDAEDIAQEVFIEVHRSIGNFRAESKISTWLYRISINRSLNFIRDNKRKKWFRTLEETFQGKNNEPHISGSNANHPEGQVENEQRARILHSAIDSLPENQKIAFTLNKYDDLSYQEIAAVMEVSLSSVESLIHRAKTNLQKKLYDCYKKKCL